MKIHVFCLCVLLSGASIGSAQPSARDSDEQLAKKIEVLQKQIDELRAKQALLLKVQKDRDTAQWEADKKNHFAKVELRGKLWANSGAATTWFVNIYTAGDGYPNSNNGLHSRFKYHNNTSINFTVEFGDRKELLAMADEHLDKEVVMTGTVKITEPISPYPSVSVESLKPAPGAQPEKEEKNEKLNRYAQVQIRGMLENSPTPTVVRIGQQNLKLNFGANKELSKFANEHGGQGVIIAGTIHQIFHYKTYDYQTYNYYSGLVFDYGNYRGAYHLEPDINVNVESMKAAEK